MDGQDKKMTQISSEVDRLGTKIGKLNEIVGVLSDKLATVSQSKVDKEKGTSTPEKVCMCKLAEDLDSFSDRVDSIIEKVISTTDSLEI